MVAMAAVVKEAAEVEPPAELVCPITQLLMEDPVMASTEVNNNQEEEGGKKVATEKRTVITVTEPEQWLCVAKLPLDTTEAELLHLLKEFGQVTESFLMVSEKNGEYPSSELNPPPPSLTL